MDIDVFQTGPLAANTLIVTVSEGEAFVVDPAGCEFSQDEWLVKSRLRSTGISPVAFVLTHGHFDHVSGLPSLRGEFPDVPILVHEMDAGMLGAESASAQLGHLAGCGFEEFLPFVTNLPEPTAFLVGGKTLADVLSGAAGISGAAMEGLSRWRVIWTPGHTPGSVCLWSSDDGVLISGDTLFDGGWGRTDLPGGNDAQIHKSLRRLVGTVPGGSTVYSGHDLRPFRM